MRYEEFSIQREKLMRYEGVCILILGLFFIGWIALHFVGLKNAITKWTKSLRYILRDDDLVVESRFEWLGFTWRASEKRSRSAGLRMSASFRGRSLISSVSSRCKSRRPARGRACPRP